MLSDSPVMATIAVKDIDKAKAFYGGTLGLAETGDGMDGEAIVYKAGESRLLVYRSQFAGTNQATVATWYVPKGDIGTIVDTLKKKGVRFERYDLPGITHEGDLHVEGDMKIAWFKDPEGNIIAVNT